MQREPPQGDADDCSCRNTSRARHRECRAPAAGSRAPTVRPRLPTMSSSASLSFGSVPSIQREDPARRTRLTPPIRTHVHAGPTTGSAQEEHSSYALCSEARAMASNPSAIPATSSSDGPSSSSQVSRLPGPSQGRTKSRAPFVDTELVWNRSDLVPAHLRPPHGHHHDPPHPIKVHGRRPQRDPHLFLHVLWRRDPRNLSRLGHHPHQLARLPSAFASPSVTSFLSTHLTLLRNFCSGSRRSISA